MIRFKGLKLIYDAVCLYDSLDLYNAKIIFNNYGYGFNRHLAVLKDCHLLTQDQDHIEFGDLVENDKKKKLEFNYFLKPPVEGVFHVNLHKYINIFKKNNIQHHNISQYSTYKIYNEFLRDEGVIDQVSKFTYRLNNHKELLSIINKNKFSETELDIKLENCRKKGKVSELIVLDYEKERLAYSPELVKMISYQSEDNISLGYDIISVTDENKNVESRYIEVKSCDDDIFYWSRNEVEKASKLKDQYFLYLVRKNKPIEIIKNPSKEIFNVSSKWKVDNNGFIISNKNYLTQRFK